MGELPTLTPINEIEHPDDVLELAVSILNEHRISWWVAFGTALGLYRDKDFIPDDTDIDIGIKGEGVDADGLIAAFNKHFTSFRLLKHDGKQTQAAFLHPSGLILDICFYYSDGSHYVSHHDDKIWKDAKYLIDDIRFRETKYGFLPFPYPTEEYLEARYGNWQVKESKKSISA